MSTTSTETTLQPVDASTTVTTSTTSMSTSSSNSLSSDSTAPAWDHVIFETTKHNFRFHPLKTPYLLLKDHSLPLDFFHAIFDDKIKDNLMNPINTFTRKKCQLNSVMHSKTKEKKSVMFSTDAEVGTPKVNEVDKLWRLTRTIEI
ncbi:hypothetical protein Bpfe_021875 [Biomphalaria pfeifferi]|uniref:Uncharacterized protein n=1 Tax=Biomphalaria pfeifferi TaxID=112525 RepID=A0AAD8B675_BIOPF|nr:hypothetical protein Bpfe_021875 [Biomphalaria pfeifferi]